MVKSRIPFVSAVISIVITACGSQLRYSQEERIGMQKEPRLTELNYDISSGMQQALYFSKSEQIPQKLVVIFPGIKSRALDWLDFAQNYPDEDAGFLMIDYPGRGSSEGSLRPSRVWQSVDAALRKLAARFQEDKDIFNDRLILIGHSFGTGAAMQFTSHKTPNRIILMAPFTKMRTLMVKRFGLLGWLIPDGMNNVEWLQNLHENHPDVPVTIFHGDKDTSISVEMSRELARLEGVEYHEVHGGTHVSILGTEREKLYKLIQSD